MTQPGTRRATDAMSRPADRGDRPARHRPVEQDWARETLQLALQAGGLGAWEWDIAAGRVHWDPTLTSLASFGQGVATCQTRVCLN